MLTALAALPVFFKRDFADPPPALLPLGLLLGLFASASASAAAAAAATSAAAAASAAFMVFCCTMSFLFASCRLRSLSRFFSASASSATFRSPSTRAASSFLACFSAAYLRRVGGAQ